MDLGQTRQDFRKHPEQTQRHQEQNKEAKRRVTSALCWKSVVLLGALLLLICKKLKFGYFMQIRGVQCNISLSCFGNMRGSFQTNHRVGPNESRQSTRVQSVSLFWSSKAGKHCVDMWTCTIKYTRTNEKWNETQVYTGKGQERDQGRKWKLTTRHVRMKPTK